MLFDFEERPAESPLVKAIWKSQSLGVDTFSSIAVSQWEMVITKQHGSTTISVRGPETKATPAISSEEHETIGIRFNLGVFMPYLPVSDLVDGAVNLPEAAFKSFWLYGSAWEFPTFDNADAFIDKLVRDGLLVHEPIVDIALQNQGADLSVRSVQRRFLRATGLTLGAVSQIERARYAVELLEQGVSILDTVELAGYSDQPHLTKSLRRFVGETPANIMGMNRSR
jgi:AraC-like DNA-binding protein